MRSLARWNPAPGGGRGGRRGSNEQRNATWPSLAAPSCDASDPSGAAQSTSAPDRLRGAESSTEQGPDTMPATSQTHARACRARRRRTEATCSQSHGRAVRSAAGESAPALSVLGWRPASCRATPRRSTPNPADARSSSDARSRIMASRTRGLVIAYEARKFCLRARSPGRAEQHQRVGPSCAIVGLAHVSLLRSIANDQVPGGRPSASCRPLPRSFTPGKTGRGWAARVT
jgi:hypothetical protein